MSPTDPRDDASPDDAPDDTGPSTSRRRVLTAAAGVGAATVATGTATATDVAGSVTSTTAAGETLVQSEPTPFAAVEFTNQPTDGNDIVVDATTLSAGGYVAIHDGTLLEGEVGGSVIGVSEYLEPGVHYSVPIRLFDVPGASFDSNCLTETAPLIAMPHQETNGNETYDFLTSGGEADGPYADAGLPVIDAAIVTVDAEDSNGSDDSFAALEFGNAAVTDGVEIRDVTLSDGGFVAVHDARLLGGDPIGSVVGASEYLEPGRHQAVTVPIADPTAITEVALPARPLFPMPHRDTNDNETLDFLDSEGADDGPYTKAGQATIDAGLVTVESD